MEVAMEDTQEHAEPEEEREEDEIIEEEEIIRKTQELIIASRINPNPNALHIIAGLLEKHEARYMEEQGHSSLTNGRASHNIGRLGNLVRENDEFFELISSRFLSEARYSTSVRAAAVRLLLSCSVTWTYPHVFEDDVLENLKNWAMDDSVRFSDGKCNDKRDLGENKPTDAEMLRTYATGLLAVVLAGGGHVVEDVLSSGLPAKLMHYLRIQVLGETNATQKDASYLTEVKNVGGVTCIKGREESRSRVRQVVDAATLNDMRIGAGGFSDDQTVERVFDDRQVHVQECWDGGRELIKSLKLTDDSAEGVEIYEVDEDAGEQIVENRWHNRELHDGMDKCNDRYNVSRSARNEDENARDDSRRRARVRHRGIGRTGVGDLENERALTPPGSGIQLGQGQNMRDQNLLRKADAKGAGDGKKPSSRTDAEDSFDVQEDNNECFQVCKVGTRDISHLVMKATRAAEAEAMAADAPTEAVKAAGDAAAEFVKSAALEVFENANDEEAAVSAASRAACTVVDAANATEVSRSSSNVHEDTLTSRSRESEANMDLIEVLNLNSETLAQLREKYCIQCLEILGEYVEVLVPVLHEKGVDVCLALLQRSSKHREISKAMLLLPDLLKLICSLGAHRKFAALFVDRGGLQKLLDVPRVAHTLFGLSSCLFTIGSLQGIMERVCALPSDVVHQVVELALQLLECPQDQARKNAAIFFAAAFVFRAILDCYDAQDGLQKSLNLLHGAASVRSGGNSGGLGMSSQGSPQNDRSPPEVLTASEKQVAFHTCVALQQYFRAHLLLLVDSLRPNKSHRSTARNVPSARPAYKPLDISNEAMDSVFLQIQRDRKLGPAFVKSCWPAVDRFLGSNGHITMLELCQAPPVDRYLHDLAQYALGTLHIVTLVPYARKLVVNATLSNNRVGMAVLLDAINGSGYVDPEVMQPALNVWVNLVCPPPSISLKPPFLGQAPQSLAIQSSNGLSMETKERQFERSMSERLVSSSVNSESRERNGEERNSSQITSTTVTSGVVGDRRISLGPGAGFAGLAAQLEQGYRQAREAVRSNNGIKVLLRLLQARILTPTVALDCVRALACRVLLGLARDDTIAHILTKLQVGKKLSELIRDSGNQTPGGEQGRWQAELAQVAIELIAVVTNSGRASTLAATDAAAPTLRRIERAAIAAATPITYHSRELLLLIHEHLQASGLTTSADSLLKEAQLTPLPSLGASTTLLHQTSIQETPAIPLQWPSRRVSQGLLSNTSNVTSQGEDACRKSDSVCSSSKKAPLVISCHLNSHSRNNPSHSSSVNKVSGGSKKLSSSTGVPETSSPSLLGHNSVIEPQPRTPIVLPMKRKLESKDTGFVSPGKRLATSDHGFRSPVCQTPNTVRKSNPSVDVTHSSSQRDQYGRLTPGGGFSDGLDESQYNVTASCHLADLQPVNPERVTLDSLVVQYLKHQHRQCPAPITTLPPLSLLHPHACPESKCSLDAPANVTARLSKREFRNCYSGMHVNRRDRHFVYSRFRPWRTCRDDSALMTCLTFLGDFSQIATGSHSGELKIYDSNSGNMLETCVSHQSPVTLVQSALLDGTRLVLSSGSHDVCLWDASSVSGGPMHSFEGCKAARFSTTGTTFAALSTESSQREVLLYDIQTRSLELKLCDSSTGSSTSGRAHMQYPIHFSPSDTMILWNGVLWDRRSSDVVRRFDQFTDYGGGGFHPGGNEVIINSEVWDLRKFKLLRSVPSLDQTVITFNACGDVIYAILRRNLEDIMSAVHTRRVRHPLFSAFRTVDATNYSDIATVPVDRCVLDLATESTDSFVGLVCMDDHEEMFASARLHEIGRRRPNNDDSDPDDVETEEDDDDDDSECDEDPILGRDLDADDESDAEDLSNDEDDDSVDNDGQFTLNGLDFDGDTGILDIMTDGEDDDSPFADFSSGSSGDD